MKRIALDIIIIISVLISTLFVMFGIILIHSYLNTNPYVSTINFFNYKINKFFMLDLGISFILVSFSIFFWLIFNLYFLLNKLIVRD